jgi:hypothetical protein
LCYAACDRSASRLTRFAPGAPAPSGSLEGVTRGDHGCRTRGCGRAREAGPIVRRLWLGVRRLRGPDGVNRFRRHLEQRVDQAWTLARSKFERGASVAPFDGDPRFALLTVNFSTTRYLKLMFLTLTDQNALSRVRRIVIVDNRSRDGGVSFLRALAQRVDRVHLVEHRHFLNHARGMRSCVRALDRVEAGDSVVPASNLLLFCDPDVVFRNPATLRDLGDAVVEDGAAFVGELRRPPPDLDVQASFFVVRRDIYERRDVAPFVNHGSPALWMQRSIWRAGLPVADFPSNHGGYVLHRGRTAVAAAHELFPHHSYSTADARHPHFMGVREGPRLWAETEERFAELLRPDAETRLLAFLAERLI